MDGGSGGRCHITDEQVSRPRFGEEDRELSYGSYLRVPELLSIQTLLSEPPAHDELFANWRLRHVLMVERQIGSKTGTGGSTGVSYLRTTLDKRFYPELWGLRSYL